MCCDGCNVVENDRSIKEQESADCPRKPSRDHPRRRFAALPPPASSLGKKPDDLGERGAILPEEMMAASERTSVPVAMLGVDCSCSKVSYGLTKE
jgi:hypothetical protein